MKRTTKHVALDVHQATAVASVREESGRVIARSVVPTDGPNGLRVSGRILIWAIGGLPPARMESRSKAAV